MYRTRLDKHHFFLFEAIFMDPLRVNRLRPEVYHPLLLVSVLRERIHDLPRSDGAGPRRYLPGETPPHPSPRKARRKNTQVSKYHCSSNLRRKATHWYFGLKSKKCQRNFDCTWSDNMIVCPTAYEGFLNTTFNHMDSVPVCLVWIWLKLTKIKSQKIFTVFCSLF